MDSLRVDRGPVNILLNTLLCTLRINLWAYSLFCSSPNSKTMSDNVSLLLMELKFTEIQLTDSIFGFFVFWARRLKVKSFHVDLLTSKKLSNGLMTSSECTNLLSKMIGQKTSTRKVSVEKQKKNAGLNYWKSIRWHRISKCFFSFFRKTKKTYPVTHCYFYFGVQKLETPTKSQI